LLEFTIAKVKGTEGIRNPRAYALKVIRDDCSFWEAEYWKHQQNLQQTDLPPPLPLEQKKSQPEIEPEERDRIAGLIAMYRSGGKPVPDRLIHRAEELGITSASVREESDAGL
jgi:hypothetical protein